MTRDEFAFSHRLRVRWAESDPQGIVFNAHYLTYFDVASTEYWRAAGVRYPADLATAGTDIFAVKATVEYHASAHFDDELDICCRVSRIGRSSMTLAFGIWRAADHLVSGELIYVNADPKTRQSAPWPDALTAAIRRFERTAPL